MFFIQIKDPLFFWYDNFPKAECQPNNNNKVKV